MDQPEQSWPELDLAWHASILYIPYPPHQPPLQSCLAAQRFAYYLHDGFGCRFVVLCGPEQQQSNRRHTKSERERETRAEMSPHADKLNKPEHNRVDEDLSSDLVLICDLCLFGAKYCLKLNVIMRSAQHKSIKSRAAQECALREMEAIA